MVRPNGEIESKDDYAVYDDENEGEGELALEESDDIKPTMRGQALVVWGALSAQIMEENGNDAL